MSIVARGLGLPASSLVAGGLGIAEAITALSGDGEAEQSCGLSFGQGATFAKSGQYVGGQVGGKHGKVPPPAFLADIFRRQKEEEEAALRALSGDGEAEQPAGVSFGTGRIKRAVLVASCGVAESCAGSAGESAGEFVDVELAKFVLAAAVGVNEWLEAA